MTFSHRKKTNFDISFFKTEESTTNYSFAKNHQVAKFTTHIKENTQHKLHLRMTRQQIIEFFI